MKIRRESFLFYISLSFCLKPISTSLQYLPRFDRRKRNTFKHMQRITTYSQQLKVIYARCRTPASTSRDSAQHLSAELLLSIFYRVFDTDGDRRREDARQISHPRALPSRTFSSALQGISILCFLFFLSADSTGIKDTPPMPSGVDGLPPMSTRRKSTPPLRALNP